METHLTLGQGKCLGKFDVDCVTGLSVGTKILAKRSWKGALKFSTLRRYSTPSTGFCRIRRSLTPGNKFGSLERNGPQRHVEPKIKKKNVSEYFCDKIKCSRKDRTRTYLRGNFVGNQRFLKRYVGRKTKGDILRLGTFSCCRRRPSAVGSRRVPPRSPTWRSLNPTS
jgi:hypothetical protein